MPQLGDGDSVITRNGERMGAGWVRVLRSGAAKQGALLREKDIQSLRAEIERHVARERELESGLTQLRDRLCDTLRQALGERLVVHGEQAERLPNTLSVNFPQVLGSAMLARIPELCASTGAACHSNGTSIGSPGMRKRIDVIAPP